MIILVAMRRDYENIYRRYEAAINHLVYSDSD